VHATSAPVLMERCRTADHPQIMALVHYRPPSTLVRKAARILDSDRCNTGSSSGLWDAERIFFATTDGYTRLVDQAQSMYEHDVDVLMDDGSSDIDSIASPVKDDSYVMQVPEFPEQSPSESGNGDYVSNGSFVELYETDCKFYTYREHTGQANTTFNNPPDPFSDEDVINLCLAFSAPTKCGNKNLAEDTTMELVHSTTLEPTVGNDLDFASIAPVAGNFLRVPAALAEAVPHDLRKVDPPDTLVDADTQVDVATPPIK
jgi:hypothetical protein